MSALLAFSESPEIGGSELVAWSDHEQDKIKKSWVHFDNFYWFLGSL